MATSQQDYGELMATDIWADTTQRSCIVTGSDGKRRYINFIVHGGTAEITDTNYITIDRMNDSKVTMYSYLDDGSLEYSVDLPAIDEGATAPSLVDQPLGGFAIYAVNAADFSNAAGGYAWVLYGPGCRSETFGPDVSVTPAWILSSTDSRGPNITLWENSGSTEVATTTTSDGSPANAYDPAGINWSITSGNGTTIAANAATSGATSGFPLVDTPADAQALLDAQTFVQNTMTSWGTVDAYLDAVFAQQDFTVNYSCSYNWSNSVTGATATTSITGRFTYRMAAEGQQRTTFQSMSYSAANYKLLRINVATGAVADFTPTELQQTFSDGDIQFEFVYDFSGEDPVTTMNVAAPANVYRNFFNVCTSSLLAYGNRVWYGHATPSVYPTALNEMGPISGTVGDVPGVRYQAVTFPTSTTSLSGVPIINHALVAHHPPMESFRYDYTELTGAASLSIVNSRHMVSYTHPKRLPSQDSTVFYWAWSIDQDGGAGVDPLGIVPDNSGVGDRRTMVSGYLSVDTPFLFANTQRGVTLIAPTEDVPDPAPSATQFVVPVRDGTGLSKDWRWYQNMAGHNPFYNVPTGVIHLYLIDPVNGLWKYMGPAKESTGAAGSFGADTGNSGPYLTSQRTSRVVNLGGVLGCTSLFGELSPTLANTLRIEQEGSTTAYPASSLSAVGFTEELWLVCSNDGTNWVKVAKLTERYHDLATGKEGDSVSLQAGTSLLIGYGPRNLPIASAPCLIRKPVV